MPHESAACFRRTASTIGSLKVSVRHKLLMQR